MPLQLLGTWHLGLGTDSAAAAKAKGRGHGFSSGSNGKVTRHKISNPGFAIFISTVAPRRVMI